ncbi:porin family protein [Shewanella sp. 202IG2-18]|uniref:outer membrane beta-barrel protein n=1 Tax=Parashewanella hymeniacidonis TaxID=2807618 RepID=UPI0019612A71|nr:outer membrane beta-barrel protein [Parashewanella hymeniacidonis]MBM7070511.1 porin family protein [Parashewanella hymeniacidonis]
MFKRFLVITFALFSFSAVAKPFDASLTGSFTMGTSADKSNYHVENDDVMLGFDVAYQYHIDNNWGVELGYKTVSPDVFTSIINDVFDNDIVLDDVDTVRLAGQYTSPISERNQLLFSLGVQRYDVTYRLRNSAEQTLSKFDKDGFSYYARVGWRYQFDGGFLLGLSYDYQDLDVLDMGTGNLTLGFSF